MPTGRGSAGAPATGRSLVPFEDLVRSLRPEMPAYALDLAVGNLVANVLLFVPFGLALTLRGWHVPMWRVAMVSAALSVGIELTQGLAGNGRSADITDVLMNTLGGVCGWVLGRALLLALRPTVHWIRQARST